MTLAVLFVQVLRVCRVTGLVKRDHVSLAGTKVRANAWKHKEMSYARMEKSVEEMEDAVKWLLAEAEATDEAEDGWYGKDRRGEELPEELRFKQSRLAKIKEALEREARERPKTNGLSRRGR